MTAVLTKMFGTENLDLAEDVVQETFIAAMKVWPLKGIPENPSAWLFSTAKNKAVDILRRNRSTSTFDFTDPHRKLLQSEYTLMTSAYKLMNESINDDLLRMMYACCHADIAQENQIILILKTLCGFSTSEIAKAFLITEANVTKKLYRTKEFFRENKIRPEFPAENEIFARTEAVLRAIYLIYNEGYNATNSEEWIRKDLVDQSMYLCRLLAENEKTKLPEVFAAMALMCFHTSRMNSRVSEKRGYCFTGRAGQN
jgi:RNA polymerase sigma factor (sigma-70 family)